MNNFGAMEGAEGEMGVRCRPPQRVAIASPFLAAEAEGGSVGVADIISSGRRSGFGRPRKGLRFMGCAGRESETIFLSIRRDGGETSWEGWRAIYSTSR